MNFTSTNQPKMVGFFLPCELYSLRAMRRTGQFQVSFRSVSGQFLNRIIHLKLNHRRKEVIAIPQMIKRTSNRVASIAGHILQDKKSSKSAKSVAGSALAQAKPKASSKKKN